MIFTSANLKNCKTGGYLGVKGELRERKQSQKELRRLGRESVMRYERLRASLISLFLIPIKRRSMVFAEEMDTARDAARNGVAMYA